MPKKTPPLRDLTTTSYAVLGLLAIQPWSAYDLAKQMRRSMAFVWPAAERSVYQEPKNLLAHGLVRAKTELTGARARTVYRIAPAGRKALAAWLGEASAMPAFQSEALLRSSFAEFGSKEDLLATLSSFREHAAVLRAGAEAVGRSYIDGEGPFPNRQHIVALNGAFILDWSQLAERWAAWAASIVEQWDDTASPDEFPAALDEFRRRL